MTLIEPGGGGRSGSPRGGEVREGGRSTNDGEEEVPSGLKRFFGGSWKEAARYSEAAYGLVGGLLGLGLVGWLLDRYFGTKPRWLLIGLLIGGLVGFYRLGRAMLVRR